MVAEYPAVDESAVVKYLDPAATLGAVDQVVMAEAYPAAGVECQEASEESAAVGQNSPVPGWAPLEYLEVAFRLQVDRFRSPERLEVPGPQVELKVEN